MCWQASEQWQRQQRCQPSSAGAAWWPQPRGVPACTRVCRLGCGWVWVCHTRCVFVCVWGGGGTHEWVGGFVYVHVCHTCTVRICEAQLSANRGIVSFHAEACQVPMDFCCCQVPIESVAASQSAPQPRTPHLGLGCCQASSHLLGHTCRRCCSGCGGRARPRLTRLQLRRHLLLPSSTASTDQRAQRYYGSGSSSLSSPVEAQRCQRLLPVATACGLLPAAAACHLLTFSVCCMRCRFNHLQQISRIISVMGTPSGTTCSYTTR